MKKTVIAVLLLVTSLSITTAENFSLSPYIKGTGESGRVFGAGEEFGFQMKIYNTFWTLGANSFWGQVNIDDDKVKFWETKGKISFYCPKIWKEKDLGIIGLAAIEITNEKDNDTTSDQLDYSGAFGITWDPSARLSFAGLVGSSKDSKMITPMIKFRYCTQNWIFQGLLPSNVSAYYNLCEKIQTGVYVAVDSIEFERKKKDDVELTLIETGIGCNFRPVDILSGNMDIAICYDIDEKNIKPLVRIGLRIL